MSFTNSTENFHLPQWIGTDKPTWLIDMNNAFLDIDTALKSGETSRDNIMTLINQLSTTLGEVQDKVTEINDNLGDIPAEVGALKARVDLLVTHNNEQDLELKTIKQSIEDINTSFQSLSTTMNDMFRQRDTNFETYQQETADTLETIQGDVANTEADFALLKNELYEGEATTENPLGERKFVLKSELPELSIWNGVGNNSFEINYQIPARHQTFPDIELGSLSEGVYLVTDVVYNPLVQGVDVVLRICTDYTGNGCIGTLYFSKNGGGGGTFFTPTVIIIPKNANTYKVTPATGFSGGGIFPEAVNVSIILSKIM